MITEEHEEQLRQVFERAGVIAAYLFGSHARGQAHTLSDVDVAVLFAEETPGNARFDSVLRLVFELERALGAGRVDVVDMEDVAIMLRYQILRDGRLIYCTDPKRRARFYARSMSLYFDFLPSRKLYYRHLMARIKEGRLGERFRCKRDS